MIFMVVAGGIAAVQRSSRPTGWKKGVLATGAGVHAAGSGGLCVEVGGGRWCEVGGGRSGWGGVGDDGRMCEAVEVASAWWDQLLDEWVDDGVKPFVWR